jgi:hypothetical protein
MRRVATIASSLAAACVVLTGCGVSTQVAPGRISPHAGTTAPPAASTPPRAKTHAPRTEANRPSGAVSNLKEGEWLARGVVEVSRGGGALQAGEVIYRPWFFQRQCSQGRCVVYWTRRIDLGAFTAAVSFAHGSQVSFKASFKDESSPCESTTGGGVAAVGLLTSDFAATLFPGARLINATEHTYATTPACGAVEHVIRWTATRLSRAITPAVGSSAL